MADTEPLQFRIATDLKSWLQDYSDDYGISMASVIRIALTRFRNQERQLAKPLAEKDSA